MTAVEDRIVIGPDLFLWVKAYGWRTTVCDPIYVLGPGAFTLCERGGKAPHSTLIITIILTVQLRFWHTSLTPRIKVLCMVNHISAAADLSF